MAAINFPDSPTNGQTFVSGDVTYTYDGVKWTSKGANPGHVLKAGDTMTGNLTVPSLNGGPLAGFRNVIINGFDLQGTVGKMINQRGYAAGTATTSANQYCVDRWRIVVSGQSLTYSTTGGETFGVAPAGGIEQQIENVNYDTGVYTLSWEGTATASVSSGGTPHTPVANGGQFNCIRGNDLIVRFAGGTFRRVQLEPGPVATPFEHRPYGMEMALCERYYQILLAGVTIPGALNGANYTFATPYRAVPRAVSTAGISYAHSNLANATNLTCVGAGKYGVNTQWTSTVAGYAGVQFTDIIVNAEL